MHGVQRGALQALPERFHDAAHLLGELVERRRVDHEGMGPPGQALDPRRCIADGIAPVLEQVVVQVMTALQVPLSPVQCQGWQSQLQGPLQEQQL